ncbi:hypothetical protein HGM15179_012650 [Zosterops borbonicus]|uniref:Uncharacterized protein n=1 Tax=Zosterops borbonicus TaxID=364589 RepID=A0A8K1GAN2_9PASS|nr:hypothetical protein HGM15179_012650 [Zosterops borbonicus]
MLDLLFANRDGLVGDVVVGGRLGQSDHEITKFLIIGETRRYINKTLTLDFRRTDFGLFRRLILRVPWEASLKNKRVQERWVCFETEILSAQEQTVPVRQKMTRQTYTLDGRTQSELLSHLDVHKSMGPFGIHPRVTRELADELVKPLSIIYQQPWVTGEVLDDWKLVNVMPIHKKGGKADPRNYRPFTPTSVPVRLGTVWLDSAWAEGDLGVLVTAAEHEPAVCPGGQEGQGHPALDHE